jgi:uncharacterized protein (DUF2147 family)
MKIASIFSALTQRLPVNPAKPHDFSSARQAALRPVWPLLTMECDGTQAKGAAIPPIRVTKLHSAPVQSMSAPLASHMNHPEKRADNETRDGGHHMISSDTRKSLAAATALLGGLLAVAAPASAQSAAGTWLRENGESRVRIAPCGDALCGTVAWLKDPATSKSKVGQRVFFDMKPNGENKWSGQAFNPEDGKNYTGTMAVSGGALTTAGCVLGGIICRSVKWSKVN